MRAAAEAMLAQSSAATPAPSSTTAAATAHKRQRTSTQPAARSWADVASHSASVAAELLKTAPSSSSSGSWVRSATTSLAAWPVDGGCLLGYRDTQLTQVPQHSGIGTNARVAVDGCIHLEIRGQLRGHTRRVLGTPLALQVPSLAPSHPPLPSSLGCACVCVCLVLQVASPAGTQLALVTLRPAALHQTGARAWCFQAPVAVSRPQASSGGQLVVTPVRLHHKPRSTATTDWSHNIQGAPSRCVCADLASIASQKLNAWRALSRSCHCGDAHAGEGRGWEQR